MPGSLNGIKLRDYQDAAVTQLRDLYANGHARASVTLPCGSGKSVIALSLIADEDLAVVFVPTVALLAQTVDTHQRLLSGRTVVAVCNPRTQSAAPPPDDFDADDVTVASLNAVLDGLDATTSVDDLTKVLAHREAPLTIVSTYASSGTVAAAGAEADIRWDLVVCDEAHRTAGAADKPWAIMLHDTYFPADRRLFCTATARLIDPPDTDGDEPIEIASMNDPALYGPVLPALSVRDAIDAGWLSDYQVAIVAVTDSAVHDIITQARQEGHILDTEAAAAQLALLHTAEQHPDLDSVLVFHNRIAHSRAWATQLRALAKLDPAGRRTEVFHIDAGSHPRHRTAALSRLAYPHGALTVVSNVAIFAEGIDVPGLAAVMFAAPRTSTADITQIVGRALRRHPDHPDRKALVIVPVVEPDTSVDPDTRVMRSRYASAWRILTALAEDDPLLYQSLLQIRVDHPTDAAAPASRVRIDTSLLPANSAEGFTLRVLHRTTSGHAETAYRLHKFWARTHHSQPPRRYCDADGYPLGRRVAEARTAYRQQRLHRRITDLFEQIPEFSWQTRTAERRTSVDKMLRILARYLEVTGTTTVPKWVTTVDPETGKSVRLGAWLANLPQLTDDQKSTLRQLLPHHST